MAESILVLDDDESFRSLLVKVLKPTGLQVIEAPNVREAELIITDTQSTLVLAIVDFRLPETDGLTFITRIRDLGFDIPIVFVSGGAFDPQTFDWLRNVLRVSLVLQKPVQPSLFLQQIQVLLPVAPPETQQTGLSEESFQQLLGAASDWDRPLSAEELENVEKLDPERRSKIRETLAHVEVEKAVRAIQRELAPTIPPQWQKLTGDLKLLEQNPCNAKDKQAVTLLAHSLRGSAGSLGLMRAGVAAGRIEDALKLIDPEETLGNQTAWMEIFDALAEGEASLIGVGGDAAPGAAAVERAGSRAASVQLGRVLVMSKEQQLRSFARETMPGAITQFTFTDSPLGAAMRSAGTAFDAAVLDLSRFNKKTIFNLVREIRMTDMNEGVAVAFIQDAEVSLDESELFFYGASTSVSKPVNRDMLWECLNDLGKARNARPIKVLAVDDDRILTSFIQEVLSSSGITVVPLNEPANILETLDGVRPDLILLDVIMPGLSGFDICRLVRCSEEWSRIPIVFLTSQSDAEGRAAALQAGGDDFLAKPIVREELMMRVKMHVRKAKTEQRSTDSDEITGLFTPDAFITRAEEMLVQATESRSEFSIGIIELEKFDNIEDYGVFAGMNVLSTLGKLTHARFPAESLRGRWDNGIALAFLGKDRQVAEAGLSMLAEELMQIKFLGDLGIVFAATARFGCASMPVDGATPMDLLDSARRNLKRKSLA